MRRFSISILVLALALAAGGCSAGSDEGGGAGGGGQVGATVPRGAPEGGGEGTAAEAGLGDVAVASSGGTGLPTLGPRIVQTATLSLSVPRKGFQEAVDDARTLAAGLGGFVVSSSASQGAEQRLVAGSLVLRIPERSYAQAMKALAGLGRVEHREETGQDVSQESVDLQARARHLEAVERQLLELLDRADSVPAALAVQSRLDDVQLQLEQARGRLRYLDEQVAFATISLDIRERIAAASPKDEGNGIVEAWRAAGHGFVTVVGWIFVGAATVAPIVLLLLLAFVTARLVRRTMPAWRRS